jgi:aryl-alcohol dehydrogenase-like predicted oxidoreductase
LRYVEVGGARMSAIGLGTWQFGSREWGYGSDYARGEAVKIVHRALDLGVSLIDTAEIYGFGSSERIVGQAIRGRRDEVFLATKLFPIGLPVQVMAKARASARRLGVDRIDLYQQHWPSPMFPPGATMPRMRKLVESGLVRHVGVSNHSLAQWQAGLKPLLAAMGDIASRHQATTSQVALAWLLRKPNVVVIPGASSVHQLEQNVAAAELELSDEDDAMLARLAP